MIMSGYSMQNLTIIRKSEKYRAYFVPELGLRLRTTETFIFMEFEGMYYVARKPARPWLDRELVSCINPR